MTQITLSSKYQLVIPKPVRLQAHIRSGQRFVVVVKDDVISLIPDRPMASLRGLLKGERIDNIRDKRDRA